MLAQKEATAKLSNIVYFRNIFVKLNYQWRTILS